MQDIERANWHGAARPIGPLGLYVTLKDPSYREVMQLTLGHAMFQFVVSDTRDREQLLAILRRHNKCVGFFVASPRTDESLSPNRSIIIAERDLFDFSQGVPQNPNTLTPLQILDVRSRCCSRLSFVSLRFTIDHRRMGQARSHQLERHRANRPGADS